VRSASGGGPGDLVKVNPRGGREDLVISGPPDDREPTWYMAGSRSSAARQRDVALQRGQGLGGVCCDRAVATGADARRLRSGQVWRLQLSLRAVRSGLTCRYSTAGSARSRSATGDGWDPTDKTVTLNNVHSDTVNVHVVGGDDDCVIPCVSTVTVWEPATRSRRRRRRSRHPDRVHRQRGELGGAQGAVREQRQRPGPLHPAPQDPGHLQLTRGMRLSGRAMAAPTACQAPAASADLRPRRAQRTKALARAKPRPNARPT
jgi:hypothetical protein